MRDADGDRQLLIGEVARRVGISAGLLRAWERRYGLLQPVRTGAGYRLYSEDDVARVRSMVEMVNAGVSPNQAARALQSSSPEPGDLVAGRPPDAGREALGEVLERFDEAAGQAAFDRLLAEYSLPTLLTGVLLPYLREMGERWSDDDVTVSQEHFASNLIRGRLLGLARGWDAGHGRRAVLACPEGERHDIGLIAFGLALRAQGWRITYLGPDTPADSLVETTKRLQPDVLVLAVTEPRVLAELTPDVAAPGVRLAIGGAGASAAQVDRLNAIRLEDDPFQAAEQLASVGGAPR